MQQLINRLLNALVGFLVAAFRSGDANRPLPPPPPFPVGTPPTPPPLPPQPVQPPTSPPGTSPIIPGQPAATEALKWMQGTFAFVKKWRGQFIPPKFGANFQCVALVNQFTSEMWHVFWPRLSDAGMFVGFSVPGFVFIRNTPTNNPYPGDLVEWGHSPTLPWGHIAVCISADSMHINSFDQNWPIGSPAHEQGHTYVGVSGWHHKI
jgi:hypothetical protein